jgi:hypothetical protein
MPEQVKLIPILKIGVSNGNDRIYTKDAAREIVTQYRKNRNDNKPMLGELHHPSYADGGSFGVVDLSKASHTIDDVYIKEDIVFADATFLNNNNGKTALSMLEHGFAVMRPRCIGSVNEDHEVEIKQVIAFDIIGAEDDSFNGLI